MNRKFLFLVLTASLLLAACQGAPASGSQSTQTGGLQNAAPTTSPAQSAYPPASTSAAPAATGYPAPTGAPAAGNASAVQTAYPNPATTEQNAIGSSFPVEPNDQAMAQNKFFIDSASLKPNSTHPDWTDLMVEGSLPTPCNLPRVVVSPPDSQNKIVVNAYSVIPKDQICNQMIQPFNGRIAILGGYPSGTYTVVVNDKTAGELTVP